ncbi:hypothetical protein OTK49_21165 [Vibrio coralliirubri]|uniref:hypothetical protein n=1 Tax=Vibrio coralliirubri TaxID=1516159 RepID=UPI002284D6CF|nr:hypothetical protein [Vibrio coralliirubri]MCY9865031.1 hypothetical protein [Vibrio coralliirubri]
MYEFKYGVTPSNADDAKFCQMKGDSGLYGVDEINQEEETVTISSIGAYMTRDREVKPLKNIRFISSDRHQLFTELTKPTNNVDDECKIGECITNISLPNTDGLRFAVHHALLGMGLGNMTVNDVYFLMLATEKNALHERVLAKMDLETLQSYLNNHTDATKDEAEAHMHAVSKGIFVGERYELFDPLWSAKPTEVEITTANRDSIKYKTVNAKGAMSKVEKILNSRNHKMLTKK